MPGDAIFTYRVYCFSERNLFVGRWRRRARNGVGGGPERLLGGLPDGQRALFSALTVEAWQGGAALYAVDTDGQIFESTDEGDRWSIVAEVAPVSKGEFYRALAKDRGKLAIDDIQVSDAATKRLSAVTV